MGRIGKEALREGRTPLRKTPPRGMASGRRKAKAVKGVGQAPGKGDVQRGLPKGALNTISSGVGCANHNI